MSELAQAVLMKGSEISLHYGQKTILNKVSFNLKQKEIVGVVGRNGSGKSTFLKLIAKILEPDSGVLEYKSNISVGFVPQEFNLNSNDTVFESVAKGWFEAKIQAHSEDLLYVADLVKYDPNSTSKVISNLVDQPWKHLNETKHEYIFSKISEQIQALDCPKYDQKIQSLSGGEKRKVALVKALVSNPDILILDEPTNHLDIESMQKLEMALKQFKGAVLIVSHDRYFLDILANRMIEIFDGTMFQHTGNYQQYLEDKAVRLEISATEEDRRQAYLKRELNWVRAGVQARGTKDKGRLQRYFDLKNKPATQLDENLELFLPKIQPLGNKIINLEKVSLSVNKQKIVQNLSFNFTPNTILGLIGPNGSGKTTLIKAILGETEIESGKIVIGQNTCFNYQDQEKQNLNLENTPFDEIGLGQETTSFGDKIISTRKYLQRYLFSNSQIMTKIKNFSGGEKARILLAKLLKSGGNCLILDEPTNDLDLETIRLLEESILEFGGVAIVVSHDRYFLNRVCNTILSIQGDGSFILSSGNYDDFVTKNILENSGSIPEIIPKKPRNENPKNHQKLVKSLERKIEALENQIKEVEIEFANPEFYLQEKAKITKRISKLDELKLNLGELMLEWEALA